MLNTSFSSVFLKNSMREAHYHYSYILTSTHDTHKVKPIGTDFLMHKKHKELECSELTI